MNFDFTKVVGEAIEFLCRDMDEREKSYVTDDWDQITVASWSETAASTAGLGGGYGGMTVSSVRVVGVFIPSVGGVKRCGVLGCRGMG